MAFAPDYARSRRYFVYYVDNGGRDRGRAVPPRGAARPNRTQPGSRRLVIRIPHHALQPQGRPGGLRPRRPALPRARATAAVAATPTATPRTSAACSGRSSGSGRARTAATRSRGRTRSSGRAGARGEVFAYGLRNPYRFSFDRRTGALTIGDVGQEQVEEASYVRRPRQRRLQLRLERVRGPQPLQRRAPPPATGRRSWSARHGQGWCSITGGYVVRDRSLPSAARQVRVRRLCDPRLRVASVRGGRSRGGRPLGRARVRAWSRSARTRAGASTRSRWTARSTGCARR